MQELLEKYVADIEKIWLIIRERKEIFKVLETNTNLNNEKNFYRKPYKKCEPK